MNTIDKHTTFSFYKKPISNIYPSKEVTIPQIYKAVRGDYFKTSTNRLRSLNDKKKASAFKRENFNFVTFSGVFRKRHHRELIRHSGLLVFDFDHVIDIARLKSTLINDANFETELLFISPSGDGLKWVISIDLDKGTHIEYFEAVQNYLGKTYNIQNLDSSGRDVARACFLPHDPEVYIHPKYSIDGIQV